MIRISKNHLGTCLPEMMRGQSFDRALCANGHERRRLNIAARSVENTASCCRRTFLLEKFELESVSCHAASVAAKFQADRAEFFADLVETGHAEILALKQLVARSAEEFANCTDAQADHALASANRKI